MPDNTTITTSTHHVRTVIAENATLIVGGIRSQTNNLLLLLPHVGTAVHLIKTIPRNTVLNQRLPHHNVGTPTPSIIPSHPIYATAMNAMMGVLIPMYEVTAEEMLIADKAIGIAGARNSVPHIARKTTPS